MRGKNKTRAGEAVLDRKGKWGGKGEGEKKEKKRAAAVLLQFLWKLIVELRASKTWGWQTNQLDEKGYAFQLGGTQVGG